MRMWEHYVPRTEQMSVLVVVMCFLYRFLFDQFESLDDFCFLDVRVI